MDWKFWKKEPIILQCSGTCGKYYDTKDMKYMPPTGIIPPGYFCLKCWIHRWDNA